MYTSDDRGILFYKSLERHLFDGHRKSDFTNITSLRGVYLTNKLDEGRPPENTHFQYSCTHKNFTYGCLVFAFLVKQHLQPLVGSQDGGTSYK